MEETLQHILYVEDDPDIRETVLFVLEHIGHFTVTPCAGGEEALVLAPHSNAQLLLLDVMMPGIDGPTLLTALRGIPSFRDLPAVFMTAKMRGGEVEGYKKMGIAGIIGKPFDT